MKGSGRFVLLGLFLWCLGSFTLTQAQVQGTENWQKWRGEVLVGPSGQLKIGDTLYAPVGQHGLREASTLPSSRRLRSEEYANGASTTPMQASPLNLGAPYDVSPMSLEANGTTGQGKSGTAGGEPPVCGKRITWACSPEEFVSYLVCVLLLILTAGTMAGLTMGMLSLDMLHLSILKLEGDASEKVAAAKVLPLLSNHHLLLVTLLLWNSFANEALPIFLDRLVDPVSAVILSVTAVLFFGEIIPSALFTGPQQLTIASKLVPLVRCIITLSCPLAYPISKLLDILLGVETDLTRYKRKELKALVALQKDRIGDIESKLSRVPEYGERSESDLEDSTLHVDEVTIIHGALDMANKKVKDAMLPWEEVYLLDGNKPLDHSVMAGIMAEGHSRIPVYHGAPENIRGILLVKKLIVVDPDDGRIPFDLFLRRPIVVHPNTGLYDVLNRFQTGKSHMALVTEQHARVRECWKHNLPILPNEVTFVGIITIEDVIEELIQEEIEDETDVSVDICEEFVRQGRRLDDAQLREAREKWVQLALVKFKSLATRAKTRVQLRHSGLEEKLADRWSASSAVAERERPLVRIHSRSSEDHPYLEGSQPEHIQSPSEVRRKKRKRPKELRNVAGGGDSAAAGAGHAADEEGGGASAGAGSSSGKHHPAASSSVILSSKLPPTPFVALPTPGLPAQARVSARASMMRRPVEDLDLGKLAHDLEHDEEGSGSSGKGALFANNSHHGAAGGHRATETSPLLDASMARKSAKKRK